MTSTHERRAGSTTAATTSSSSAAAWRARASRAISRCAASPSRSSRRPTSRRARPRAPPSSSTAGSATSSSSTSGSCASRCASARRSRDWRRTWCGRCRSWCPSTAGSSRRLIKVRIGLKLYDWLTPGRDRERYRVLPPIDALSLEPGIRARRPAGAGYYFDDLLVFPERLCLENVLSAVPPRRARVQLRRGGGDRARPGGGVDGRARARSPDRPRGRPCARA